MDYKNSPAFMKAADDRSVVGIPVVHGNIDAGTDRSHLGSWADTKVNGRDRARFLWNHNGNEPPIAKIDYVKEIGRDDLPEQVLIYAPEATGGVEVKRTYLDTPRGNEVLAGLLAGTIDEMSYAYDLTDYKFTEDAATGLTVREIFGVKIYDYSDVSWGMNPATVGKKSALAAAPFADHFAAVLATVEEFVERAADLKRLRETDHRHLSGVNTERLKSLHAAILPMQADLLALLERGDTPTESDQKNIIANAGLRAEFARLKSRVIDLGVL